MTCTIISGNTAARKWTQRYSHKLRMLTLCFCLRTLPLRSITELTRCWASISRLPIRLWFKSRRRFGNQPRYQSSRVLLQSPVMNSACFLHVVEFLQEMCLWRTHAPFLHGRIPCFLPQPTASARYRECQLSGLVENSIRYGTTCPE
jgi:hypothetical protein